MSMIYRTKITKHMALLDNKKKIINVKYPYSIYHRHRITDYYHRHWQTYSLEKCVKSIIDHDNYVLRIEKQLEKLKTVY